MTDLYFDILQLSLLIFSFLFMIVVMKNFKQQFKSLNLFLFLFNNIVAGLFFADAALGTNHAIPASYPFLVPFFYIVGPAAFLHYKNLRGTLTPRDYWHYTPVAFFLADLLVYAFVYPGTYNQNIIYITQRNFDAITHSFFFSSTFIFYVYPVYSAVYMALTLGLSLFRKERFNIAFRPLLLAFMVYGVLTLDLILEFTNQDMFTGVPEKIRTLVLSSSSIIVLVHVILFYRGKRLSKEPFLSFLQPTDTTPKISKQVFDQMAAYIRDEYNNPNSILFNPGVTKDIFILQSEYSPNEWSHYFQVNQLRYSEVKQEIRIKRAQDLIKSGYLDKYSVEALSEEVGYRSRTSFYNAFEQVTGEKLAQYRKSHD